MLTHLGRPLPGGIGTVSQWWGEHPSWYAKYGLSGHNGLDYAAPLGTLVLASHAGIGYQGYDATGYGRYVIVAGAECDTIYAHLSLSYVYNGVEISDGMQVGLVGSTGNSTGNHLHWGARINGVWVDPLPYRLSAP